MDLDEGNDNFGMHLSKLGNYSHGQAPSKLIHDSMKAEQAKLAGTRQSRPEVSLFLFTIPYHFLIVPTKCNSPPRSIIRCSI